MYRFRLWFWSHFTDKEYMTDDLDANREFEGIEELVQWDDPRPQVVMMNSGEVDSKGAKIWESDIVTYVGDEDHHIKRYYLVCFGPAMVDSGVGVPIRMNGWFTQELPEHNLSGWSRRRLFEPSTGYSYTVIGNKFETPELLHG